MFCDGHCLLMQFIIEFIWKVTCKKTQYSQIRLIDYFLKITLFYVHDVLISWIYMYCVHTLCLWTLEEDPEFSVSHCVHVSLGLPQEQQVLLMPEPTLQLEVYTFQFSMALVP